MIVSKTGRYVLRALVHLAEHEGEDCLPVGEIAGALGVPRNYLSKILHQQARVGVLASERGPRGGFRLRVPAEELSLARALAAVDATATTGNECLLGRPVCSDTDPCLAHQRWQRLAAGVAAFLDETTIADLARRPTLGGLLDHRPTPAEELHHGR